MSDLITVTGMILYASALKETDRRLVILTRERGKITVFANGVRKQNSPLMSVCRPFIFGTFDVYEGRTSSTLKGVNVTNYFETLHSNAEMVCYASYFAEFADYYARENTDESQELLLLFLAFRALEKEKIPFELVRMIFEMRTMAINGEYLERLPFPICEATEYTLRYIIGSPLEKLYTFLVSEQVMGELEKAVQHNRTRFIDRKFHSLDVLESMLHFM